MRPIGALIASLLCGSAAGARELEALSDRPITLRRGAVDLTVHGAYTNWAGAAVGLGTSSFSGETLALGVDVGATDRVQLGLATALPIDPTAFGSVLGTVVVALDSRSALRLDAGFENYGLNGGNFPVETHTNRFFGGVGARIKAPIGPALAFVMGRTSAADLGHFINLGDLAAGVRGTGFYIGATNLTEDAADFFLVSAGNNSSSTNIGINLPAGLLLQPDPHFALTLLAGYSAVISIPGSSRAETVALHFLPVGLEAVVSPVAALDIGGRFFLDGYVAQSGGSGSSTLGYFDLRAVMVWIRVHV